MGLAALAMAIALPAHAATAWDNSLNVAPERPTMQALRARADACGTQDCAVQQAEVEGMAYWIARGNRMALRLSFAAARTLEPGSDDARALAQSYGTVIKHDPMVFLALARDAGAPAALVSSEAAGTGDGDIDAQTRELEARRNALLQVNDPTLVALRDECVSGIAARLTALAPQVADADMQ